MSATKAHAMTTRACHVTGMTCGHCANAVTEEVSVLEGVSTVDVDVPAAKVAVTSAAAVSDETMRAAVGEAGCEFVGTVD